MVRVVRLERTVSWSQTRRDTNFAIPGYSISAIIPRRRGKSKIFLSVVIPVVKAAVVPLSATGESPANAGVARLRGVLNCPVPDTATALPNHPRYQLRHTRISSLLYHKCLNSSSSFWRNRETGWLQGNRRCAIMAGKGSRKSEERGLRAEWNKAIGRRC